MSWSSSVSRSVCGLTLTSVLASLLGGPSACASSQPEAPAQAAGDPSRFVGENIAAGSSTPEATMRQWIDSPGHCVNMLSHEYKVLGVGHARSSNAQLGDYWTQVFGG